MTDETIIISQKMIVLNSEWINESIDFTMKMCIFFVCVRVHDNYSK